MGLPNRFWAKVDKQGAMPLRRELGFCWIWTAACNSAGYGTLESQLAHRLTYAALHGAVPEGLELDHLCRVTSCCNPAHLEAVTHAENCRRGDAVRVMRERMAKITHCPRGHEYTESNTIIAGGARHCRACNRGQARAARGMSETEAYDEALRPRARLTGSSNPRSTITDEAWAEALRMLDAGASKRSIARFLGVNKSAVQSRLKRRNGMLPAEQRAAIASRARERRVRVKKQGAMVKAIAGGAA